LLCVVARLNGVAPHCWCKSRNFPTTTTTCQRSHYFTQAQRCNRVEHARHQQSGISCCYRRHYCKKGNNSSLFHTCLNVLVTAPAHQFTAGKLVGNVPLALTPLPCQLGMLSWFVGAVAVILCLCALVSAAPHCQVSHVLLSIIV
jgi:hypothetical protein